MKNACTLFLLPYLLLLGTLEMMAQTSAGDFQYAFTVSDSLYAPTRMAIGQDNVIYVVDAYHLDIREFDASGNLIDVISPTGRPLSLAVDDNNQLFMGERETGNIYRLDASGVATLFYTGSLFPSSMVFGPGHLLYISDSRLKKVLVIDASGTLVQSIGEGTLVFPTGIAFDHKNQRIIVGEHGAVENNLQTRVYIFNPDGSLYTMFVSYGNADGKLYRVQGIASGRCGNIYVCEPFQGNVSVFNENGIFITRFGQFGSGQGQLNVPMDVAFDPQGRLFLSSMNNGSLEIFTITDSMPSASINSVYAAICEGETADIQITLTGTPPWSLTYTVNGQNPVTINNIVSNPYLLTVSQAGIYKVSGLSDAYTTGTCFSGIAEISVLDAPTAGFTVSGLTICEGEFTLVPVQFTGDSPWAFTYTRNGSDPQTVTGIDSSPYFLELSLAGTYEITSVTGPFCEGEITGGGFSLTVNPLPTASIPFLNDTVCSGEQLIIPVHFTGTAPWTFDYALDNGTPVTIITGDNPYLLGVSLPGTYTLTAVSDASCTGTGLSGMVTLGTLQEPVAGFYHSAEKLRISFSNISQNATIFYWQFGDKRTSHLVNPVHRYRYPGVYTVILNSGNKACGFDQVMQTITVTAPQDTAAVYPPNQEKAIISTFDEENLNIYPNPSQGEFKVELTALEYPLTAVEVSTITGRVVLDQHPADPAITPMGFDYSFHINMSQFPSGVYGLKIFTTGNILHARLVINK